MPFNDIENVSSCDEAAHDALKCTHMKGLPELEKDYGQLFKDLVKAQNVETDLDMINCIITYDSKHVVVIQGDERIIHAHITAYTLKTYEQVFKIELSGKYIVMNEIEQNIAGEVICVPYNDNGLMRLIIMHNTGEVIDTLHINTICKTDNLNKPVFGFLNPLVTCCFNHDGDIFV